MKDLKIKYKNWRGEVSVRNITPKKLYWGSNEYHPEPQWLLYAFDLDKCLYRHFALRDMEVIEGNATLYVK